MLRIGGGLPSREAAPAGTDRLAALRPSKRPAQMQAGSGGSSASRHNRTQVSAGAPVDKYSPPGYNSRVPKWRNGRRGGLKNLWRQLRGGSSPPFGSTLIERETQENAAGPNLRSGGAFCRLSSLHAGRPA